MGVDQRYIGAFAENLLRKYGIKEHDIRLSYIFDEKALVSAMNRAQARNISAGLYAPPKLNSAGG